MKVLAIVLAFTASQYNETGVAINDTLDELSRLTRLSRGENVDALFDSAFSRLAAGRPPALHPDTQGLASGEWTIGDPVITDRAAAMAFFASWVADTRTYKLIEVENIAEDGTATALFRFEHRAGPKVERGRFRGTFAPATRALRSVELLEATVSVGPGTLFPDRAEHAGLDFYGAPDARFVPPSDALRFQTARHSIGGVSAGDVNGDGADDVLMVGGAQLQLFVNRGDGNFDRGTAAAGLDGLLHVNVAALADFDNDGDEDLFLGIFYGHNKLFRNDGTGHFTDVTRASGLDTGDMTAVVAVVDVDNDGNLDLYLGRWLDMKNQVPDMIHYTRNGEPNILYRGRGDLTFDDVSRASGADDPGLTLGVAAGDYDLDGDQDLYLANDFGRNVLLRNKGDGTFEDVAKRSGALAISGGMSASFGDYDGDGWLDIYVSSIASNQRWFSHDRNVRGYVLGLVESERRDDLRPLFLDLRAHLGDDWSNVGQHELAGNYLLHNRGDGTFDDVSDASGARQYGWYWGAGFFDADNDGYLDIYAANGWITGEKTHDL